MHVLLVRVFVVFFFAETQLITLLQVLTDLLVRLLLILFIVSVERQLLVSLHRGGVG